MTRALRVLATGPSGPAEELDPLRIAGHEVVIGRPLDDTARRPWAEAELAAAVASVDVILASHLETISAAVMEGAPALSFVVVPFIGVDKIDLAAATRLGVLVANSPTRENFAAVAEAAIALALVLMKRVKHNETRLRQGQWSRRQDRGDFLFGKTVGLVGLGKVGRELARRLLPWEVRLIAHDPFVEPEAARALGVELVDLDTLLGTSDVVTLHAALTDKNRGMIGATALARMKPSAVLVNTARGELVDEPALARAIEERRIAGAALDTFAREPLPGDSPLLAADPARLILTPHNVSHSEAGRRANLALALDQILAVGRGEAPAHVMNPEAIPRWRRRP